MGNSIDQKVKNAQPNRYKKGNSHYIVADFSKSFFAYEKLIYDPTGKSY